MAQVVRHILLATDGSHCAEVAFQRALERALADKAQLTLLHVAQQEGAATAASDVGGRDLSGGALAFERRAREAGVRRVQSQVTSGLAYSRILQAAERLDVDLIVLGATGAGGTGSLGEVASHVVKFANCSVLIVR